MPSTLDPRHAVYVGSFDPPTLGHLDIVQRGSRLFETLTVGVGINPEKKALFTTEERMQLIQLAVGAFPNVRVRCFRGLAVNFVKECGGAVMLRGMRTLSDIESEFTMTLANRALAPEIETVFLMASEKYTHISSTLIKQIAELGSANSEEQLKAFVPSAVIAPLRRKFQPLD